MTKQSKSVKINDLDNLTDEFPLEDSNEDNYSDENLEQTEFENDIVNEESLDNLEKELEITEEEKPKKKTVKKTTTKKKSTKKSKTKKEKKNKDVAEEPSEEIIEKPKNKLNKEYLDYLIAKRTTEKINVPILNHID